MTGGKPVKVYYVPKHDNEMLTISGYLNETRIMLNTKQRWDLVGMTNRHITLRYDIIVIVLSRSVSERYFKEVVEEV